MIRDTLVLVLLAGGTFGCLFMALAVRLVGRFARSRSTPNRPVQAVTILKPLHGDEGGLFENLASFCNQDYAGPVQIVFGVASPSDPAIGVVERLRRAFPDKGIELVVDARVAGSNPKVANLINISRRIAHEIVVIADSDIRVAPDYLSQVVSGLARQGGGAVTCPYYGISTGALWSQLSRLSIDGHFLPGVVVSVRFALSRPCFGSTIALSHNSLNAIGGFEAVADCLADDYALGEALAKRGEPVSVLPYAVGHVCNESSFGELWRHEVRWALTIRSIDPWGYLGSAVTHAFPLAVLALCLGGGLPAGVLALAALACRAVLLMSIQRGYRLPAHSYWLIPLRDLLSFAVFLAAFFARDVNWKSARYRLLSEGTLMSERRSPSP
ncbi:MAG: bacteriohopanetetrol glucosamine biosynthesis glycosyltransferase HpnI [Xanthobacteraceae bacterium]